MAKQELVDYIVSLNSGKFSRAQVQRVLLEVGWSESDVNAAFVEAERFNVVLPEREPWNLHALVGMVAIFLLAISLPLLGSLQTPTGNVVAPVLGGSEATQAVVLAEAAVPDVAEVIVLEEVESPSVEVVPEVAAHVVSSHVVSSATEVLVSEVPVPSCESLTGKQRDECFASKGDKESCKLVRDASLFAQCMTDAAVSSNDVSLCGLVADKDSCLNEFAGATGDTSVCKRIVRPAIRESCGQ